MLTVREIAARSGLPRSTVCELSKLTTWKSVTVGNAFLFASACGVDLLHPRRQIEYVKHRMKLSIRKASPIQRKMIQSRFQSLRQAAH